MAGLLIAGALGSCSATPEVAGSHEPELANAPTRVRALTQDQYFNSLAYIFGQDARLDARFPPFRRTDGLLALGASAAGVTTSGVEKFQHTAQLIATQVVDVSHRDFVLSCKPKSLTASDAACATQFIKATARLLYRQPLSDQKLATAVGAANEAADRVHDFY